MGALTRWSYVLLHYTVNSLFKRSCLQRGFLEDSLWVTFQSSFKHDCQLLPITAVNDAATRRKRSAERDEDLLPTKQYRRFTVSIVAFPLLRERFYRKKHPKGSRHERWQGLRNRRKLGNESPCLSRLPGSPFSLLPSTPLDIKME